MKPIIILGLLIQGCGLQNPDEGFYVHPEFTKKERSEIQVAADEECERTQGRFCPELLDFEWVNEIKKVKYLKPKTLDVSYGRTYIYRSLVSAKLTILIAETKKDEIFKQTIRHELGHAGGCVYHLKEDGNLMYYDVTDAPSDWTDKDIECIDDNYED